MKFVDRDLMIIVVQRRRARVRLRFGGAIAVTVLAWVLSFFWPVVFPVMLGALVVAIVQLVRYARLTAKLEELER